MKTIGIIGHGFVGQAVEYGFRHVKNLNVLIYDKYKNIGSFANVVNNSNILFVCVPTPMDEADESGHGKCNTKIVEDVIRQVHELAQDKRKIIVVKSTVPPGTCEHLNKIVEGKHTIVFNPEFLTEKNWRYDFINQDPIVLGTCDTTQNIEPLVSVYREFSNAMLDQYSKQPAQLIRCTAKEAEMTKYTLNTYFAAKVIFFNDLKKICEVDGVNYNTVKNIVSLDERMGKTHLDVPGPDGMHGFGGTCFPKDINGFLHYAYTLGVNTKELLLAKAWDLNKKYREFEDWKERVGATTKNNYNKND